MNPTKLQQVRKIIQKKYPKLDIAKGNGYYYWCSDDQDVGLYLATLMTTSILVNHVSQLTLDKWISEADEIMSDYNR